MTMFLRLSVIFLFVFLLGSCISVPLLHTNSAAAYERCSYSGEKSLYGQWSLPLKEESKIFSWNASLGAKYQLNDYLGVGLAYQQNNRDYSSIKLFSAALPLQRKFGDYYMMLTPKYGFGKLKSSVGANEMKASFYRCSINPVVGVRIQDFDLQVNLNYFYQNYNNISGALTYEGVDQIEQLKRVRSWHNLAPSITMAYNWDYFPTVYVTLGGYNILTKRIHYFHDNNINLALGVNIAIE